MRPSFKLLDCESFLESNCPDFVAVWETNLDDSTDETILWWVIFPYFRKDSTTHMHSLAVYVKEENSSDSYLCFWLAFLNSVSYFFYLYGKHSSLCKVFDFISSNVDEVLSMIPSANLFVFGDFNVHHKDWLTYADGTGRSDEFCYNFSISNNFTQMINFPTGIPGCDSHSPALWIYFNLLMPVFVLQWLSVHCEILIMLLSRFPLTFHHIHNGMAHFIA